MAKSSWKKGSPLQKFTSGYWPHRMDSTAIRELIAKKLRRQSPASLLAWIKREVRETDQCLDALSQMDTSDRVRMAIANANEHRVWLSRIRAAVPLASPPPQRMPVKHLKRAVRVGLMAQEAQAYRAKSTRDPA